MLFECFPEHLLGASDFLPGHQLWSLSSLLSLCEVLPWRSPKPPPALEAACWQGLSAMTGSVANFTAIRRYLSASTCGHAHKHKCICENNSSFALYLPGASVFCPFGSLRNLSLCHQPAVTAQDRSSADGGWAALWKLAGWGRLIHASKWTINFKIISSNKNNDLLFSFWSTRWKWKHRFMKLSWGLASLFL